MSNPLWNGLCSEDAPPEFDTDQLFVKYAPSLVGETLMRQPEEITEKTHYSFTLQWAWESSLLIKSTGLTIHDRVFWQRGDSDSEWYACYNFRLTDILLSAFLRTLAWIIKKKAMGLGRAKWSAALCCPIDLALWKVEPRSRPAWWPGLAPQKEVNDTSTREVVASLEKAFKEFISEECEWLPVQANGFVGGDGTKVFLEIYGLLQWCLGSKEPDNSEIVRWCGSIVSSTFLPHSLLATAGTLGPKSLHLGNRQRQVSDWVLAPAFEIIPFVSGINWQWWRYYRKLWGPANFLTDSPLLMEPTRDGMIFRNEEHDVAQWFDWADLVRETVDANLPPCTGQCLLVKRELLAKVVAPMQPNLCWVWSITIFHRPYQSGRYEMVTHDGQLGAARLVRT